MTQSIALVDIYLTLKVARPTGIRLHIFTYSMILGLAMFISRNFPRIHASVGPSIIVSNIANIEGS